jgi:glycosyltransferase involved in cell wall biosynthesis
MKISLLTGGSDPHYALPLTSALISKGVDVDFVGNDAMQNAVQLKNIKVNYVNLRGSQESSVSWSVKVHRVLRYYVKLIRYSYSCDSEILHILWLNKFELIDRIFLNLYYKALGKRVVFTAHNINIRARDGNDSFLNRFTLKAMYKIVDHVFVHSEKMKQELMLDFEIKQNKITVIPFGINNTVPTTVLSRRDAREKLSLDSNQKVLLFFGNIAPYKGLGDLIDAIIKLKDDVTFRLIVAGRIKKNAEDYFEGIDAKISKHNLEKFIINKIGFIPDEDIEIYAKASDVLILPYRQIFQSGVLFLAYNFGLPVIATDVGSFKEEIVEGETGFICEADKPKDLADKIEIFYESSLFKNLEKNRSKIIEYANGKYSWEKVADITYQVYRSLL